MSDSKADTSESELYLNSKKDFRPNKFEDFGYFFYPERFGNLVKQSVWYEKLVSFTGSSDTMNKASCEKNVQNAIENRNSMKIIK